MSMRYKGGVISATSPTVTPPVDGEGGSASGIWSLETQAQYAGSDGWPKPIIPREGWGWGYSVYGQSGVGGVTYSSPVQIGSGVDFSYFFTSISVHNEYIKLDGTLWAMGLNDKGQLGDGTTTNRANVGGVQIGSLTTWRNGAVGGDKFTLATTTDNKLYAWGYNYYGMLGLGNTTNYSSPVQVGALTTWAVVVAGNSHTGAVRTDGTIWTWGQNTNGQLGQGNTTIQSSPVQVGALTTWSKMAAGSDHTLAIKTDGTLWAWGGNGYGQLGQSNTTANSSPVQIGSATDWLSISAGNYTSIAVSTANKVYSCGRGTGGRLGHNNTTNISAMTQIGSLTNWSGTQSTGHSHSFVIKTDGTLWTWGDNQFGRLGLGDITNRSSPVQVGALTTWRDSANAGWYHSNAIKSPS
jgi:alpha-tubulin suppressor-like RCC1 family protein